MTASRIVIAAFLGLWSIFAFGQATPAPAPPPSTPDQQGQAAGATNPPPANAADANAAASDAEKSPPSGPDIVDDANATPEQKASAEYSGPAVLSRGISASEPMNPKTTRFTPMVGIDYTYSSGLTGVAVQSNGQLPNANASGVSVTYGLTGQKVYKRDIFSLTFSGSIYDYINQSAYDGTSNSLALTWHHHLSRHLSFGVSVSGSEFSNNNLLVSGANYINSGAGTTLVTATPATEVFDGRVISLFTQGDVTYQFNSRLSINLTGGGFLTRRASSALYGDTGYQAGADVAYRLTRRVTTGVYYSYTYFDFIGTYGSSAVNTVGVIYSIAFTPATQLVTRLGGSRLETTGVSTVAIDPLLGLLLGTPTVLEAIYQKNYAPDINVEIRHKVTNWTMSLAYTRGITPGNGIILTSVRQSGIVGANRKLGRNWNFNATGGYDSLSGYGATNQKYASVFLNGGVTRNLHRNLAWHARLDYHHYTFDNTGFLRNSYTIATGVIWTPDNILERIW